MRFRLPGASAGARELARRLDSGDEPAVVRALREQGRREAAAAGPSPEARERMRAHVLAEATATGQQGAAGPVALPGTVRARPARDRAPRRVLVVRLASLVVVLAVLVAGVLAGAARSLPGQPLYGVKRTAEAVQLRYTDSTVTRGVRHLELAQRRLEEVRALSEGRGSLSVGSGLRVAAGGRSDEVARTLDEMDRQTRTGASLIDEAVRASGDPTPWSVVQAWSTGQQERIRAVVGVVPEPVRARADASLSLIAEVNAVAARGGPYR